VSCGALIAGIGNIFNRDDGFGVEVACRLAGAELPENVRVADFGIRGFDLVLALLDGPELTIFVDTVQRGGAPGTLYAMEPDLNENDAAAVIENGHGLDPVKVLAMARSMGAPRGRVIVIGCEPATLGDDSGVIGLSQEVQAAVDPAIEMIRSLVNNISREVGVT